MNGKYVRIGKQIVEIYLKVLYQCLLMETPRPPKNLGQHSPVALRIFR
jgi:hypothetical protein